MPRGRTVKILAIDDVQLNLEMLEVMLAEFGCVFLKAENGLEALEILKRHPDTDTVLLDLTMPFMNGLELLARLKLDALLCDIPVIVITSDQDKILKSLAIGANDSLSKPYNSDELKLMVTNHLRERTHELQAC